MVRKEDIVQLATRLMKNQDNIRNIGIVAHIDHGKTTMTDSLIAAAGLISQELAGKMCFMDFYELEQQRGITINASNISLVHEYENQDYLVNVIDTPGHVDFGGDVIRAMRAVDGVILVVDSVEGVMPQTETVLRQALREYVKPVLFINKVDRLVNELKLNEQQMQERFIKTINDVNRLIKNNAPEQFKQEWLVNVEKGSVVFGSGFHKWAISVPRMKKTGITFKDVYLYCKEGKQKELCNKAPLHVAILEMVINHLPNPKKAQQYRIPIIWKGDLESQAGKSMLECDINGPFAMMITDVNIDPHAGDIATGRIYSGTIRKGMKVKAIGMQKEVTVQQVAIYMGPDRVAIEEVSAGNIAAIIGLKEAYAGETVASEDILPFESFKTSVEPVITVSIEAKSTKDLPKLIEVIKQITKEDPNVVATINQETGEHLVSGMGELHLEVVQYRIENDHKVPIQVSPPIVVYKETVTAKSKEVESKSPNKHNKLYITVEPIEKNVLDKMIEEKLEGKIRLKDKEIVDKMVECGLDKDTAKRVWCIHNNCLLVDMTRGIQALHEIKELVIQGFIDAMNEGPLAKEKCMGVMVKLNDAVLHEDAIHRGPAQMLPTVTKGIYAAMLYANPILLEPKQLLTINVPEAFMGAVSRELGSRRTQIIEMRQEGDSAIIVGKAPVKELIGFSAAIRGATQGRAIWTGEYAGYEPLPRELQQKVIAEVRKRKGLDAEPKKPEDFLEK
ncbi:MAG: elongation factor EF-2 [Candidatus Diapherotrites archaeon]|nr:elongation factor EF-2 [Candidatus Diapherotrites archaeon]